MLVPFHLTFARYEALMLLYLSRRGSLPLGKIGQRLQVHPARVTNVIDRLEGDTLVRRQPHPEHGRTTLAVITRRGRAVAREATQLLNDSVFVDELLATQGRSIVASLAAVRHAAGDFAGD